MGSKAATDIYDCGTLVSHIHPHRHWIVIRITSRNATFSSLWLGSYSQPHTSTL